LNAKNVKLLKIIDKLTLETLSSGLKRLQELGGFSSLVSWVSNIGFLVDAFSKLAPEQKTQYNWWCVAATLESLELLLMISFVIATNSAIKQNQKHISSDTFKFLKFNIIISDLIFECIVTGIVMYLTFHLEFETSLGLTMVFSSTVMNLTAGSLELRSAINLEKFTTEQVQKEEAQEHA
jgi:hypothetical protein